MRVLFALLAPTPVSVLAAALVLVLVLEHALSSINQQYHHIYLIDIYTNH